MQGVPEEDFASIRDAVRALGNENDERFSALRHTDQPNNDAPPLALEELRSCGYADDLKDNMHVDPIDDLMGHVDSTQQMKCNALNTNEKASLAAFYLHKAMQLHTLGASFEKKAAELLPPPHAKGLNDTRVCFKPKTSSKLLPVRQSLEGGKFAFNCDHCGLSFRSWSGCDSHIQKDHTFQKIGPCQKCKVFSTFNSDSFRKHLKECNA